jgi:MFS family permease
LVAAVLGTALAYMSDDMLNLAVPSVAQDLHITAGGVQWILDAYYIPLVAFALVAGSVGDILGHRRVFRTGPLLFLVRPGRGRYTKHIQAAAPPMSPTQRATLTQSMSA